MEPTIQLDKEPSIMVRQPHATMQLANQDIQLVSKHSVLSFKPQLRLEWRAQGGQDETEYPDHSSSLDDSVASSTRIRFSVHTGQVTSERRRKPFQFARGAITRYSKRGDDSDSRRTGSPGSDIRHQFSGYAKLGAKGKPVDFKEVLRMEAGRRRHT
jgi:hypothetical protein